jgi:hypothetical protein
MRDGHWSPRKKWTQSNRAHRSLIFKKKPCTGCIVLTLGFGHSFVICALGFCHSWDGRFSRLTPKQVPEQNRNEAGTNPKQTRNKPETIPAETRTDSRNMDDETEIYFSHETGVKHCHSNKNRRHQTGEKPVGNQ